MDKKPEHIRIGITGELIASKFLERKGFEIVERNYLKRFGEIDIICEKGGILHFVEVKTVSRETVSRETGDEYRPEDNIHSAKLRRIGHAIEAYIHEKSYDGDWCFDAISVFLSQQSKTARVFFHQDLII